MRTGQLCFYATFVVPTLIYYCAPAWLRPDPSPRFPATISYTIRRGLPKWVHHTIWLGGWHCVLGAHAGPARPLGRAFLCQMVATGVVATVLAPCGHTVPLDALHYLGAFFYMVDHIALLRYWRMPLWSAAGFAASFLAFAVATRAKKGFKHRNGLALPVNACPKAIEVAAAEKLGPPSAPLRARLWQLEAAEMTAEFGLFLFFVAGMDGARCGVAPAAVL